MRRLLLAVTVGALVFAFAPVALAHDFEGFGDCDGWTLNLDGDYGATEIYVDGQPVGLALTYNFPDTSDDEQRTFTVFWDKPRNDVTRSHTLTRELDCDTPPPPNDSTTTTTLPETTTVTEPDLLLETGFSASAVCLPNGDFTLTVDFGEGIVFATVVLLDGQYPPGQNFDGITLTPANPTTGGRVTGEAEFEVTAVALEEYEITTPNPVVVSVPACPRPTGATTPTTTPAPSTTVSTPTVLPFTGSEDVPLALAAVASVVLGGLLLWPRKRTEDQL